ncbi:MAG: NTP transferase domain-containing protein [Gammaproteobacteria bacterium]|nr:NTP transferase domain-containing protein [Gammaproteobacteria bacterium]
MNTNLSALLATYHSLRSQHQQLVLATIVETMGSTYRKAGARMLITPDAEYFGLLGGGCFEADLLAHAQEVFQNQHSKIVFYDMRAPDDEIWGLGLGCNGAVRILLQLFSTGDPQNPLTLIENALTEKQNCVLFTICESEEKGLPNESNFLLQFRDDEVVSAPTNWPSEYLQLVKRTWQSGKSLFSETGSSEHSASVFSSQITPPFHLLIIGAGPDAAPIVKIAKLLGWEISIVDYREAFLNQAEFSEVDNLILSTPEQLVESLNLQRIDAIVLMTHKIEYDERYLRSLTETTASYIGLLGPIARRERLLDQLGDDRKLIQERIFGPVGLDLGGELPEEIALSLIAEIQSVLHKRDGASLNSKSQPLHPETDFGHDDLYALILAAGGAKRFGGLKQLIEYEGTSLLRRSILTASSIVGERIKVVLGARARKVKRDIDTLKAGIVINERWEDGMATSLQAGIEALPDECNGILLILCDQARINADHLQQLLDQWLNDKSKIIASEYAGTRGAPAIIPRHAFQSIMKLHGDKGAKSIIESKAAEVILVNMPAGEFDVDTQDDYMALLSEE